MSKVRRVGVGVGVGLLLALSGAMLRPLRVNAQQNPQGYFQRSAVPIGILNHVLTGNNLVESNVPTLRLFVVTGSESDRCLLTINEWTRPTPGIALQCSPRVFEGRKGLVVSAFLPAGTEVDESFEIYLNIYQEFATAGGVIDCAELPDEVC